MAIRVGAGVCCTISARWHLAATQIQCVSFSSTKWCGRMGAPQPGQSGIGGLLGPDQVGARPQTPDNGCASNQANERDGHESYGERMDWPALITAIATAVTAIYVAIEHRKKVARDLPLMTLHFAGNAANGWQELCITIYPGAEPAYFNTITCKGGLISEVIVGYSKARGRTVSDPDHLPGSPSIRRVIEVPSERVSKTAIDLSLAISCLTAPSKLYISLTDSESRWIARQRITAVARIRK